MKRIISYRLISVSLRFYVSVCAYACVPACVCMCACLLCGPIVAFNFTSHRWKWIFFIMFIFSSRPVTVADVSTKWFFVWCLEFQRAYWMTCLWLKICCIMRIKIGTVDSKWIITAHSCCHSLRTMSIEIMSRITIFLHRKFPTTLCCCWFRIMSKPQHLCYEHLHWHAVAVWCCSTSTYSLASMDVVRRM